MGNWSYNPTYRSYNPVYNWKGAHLVWCEKNGLFAIRSDPLGFHDRIGKVSAFKAGFINLCLGRN